MEQPREWDLIQYGNSVVRRAVRLLRDDSNDESAVRETSRQVQRVRGTVSSTNSILWSLDQQNLEQRLVEVDAGLQDLLHSLTRTRENVFSGVVEVCRNGEMGRPLLNVTGAVLQGMIAGGQNGPAMARLLGCSLRTVMRRLQEHGILLGVNVSETL